VWIISINSILKETPQEEITWVLIQTACLYVLAITETCMKLIRQNSAIKVFTENIQHCICCKWLRPILLKNISLKLTPVPCRNRRKNIQGHWQKSRFTIHLRKTGPTIPWAERACHYMHLGGGGGKGGCGSVSIIMCEFTVLPTGISCLVTSPFRLKWALSLTHMVCSTTEFSSKTQKWITKIKCLCFLHQGTTAFEFCLLLFLLVTKLGH
jgi:hypothetical protein